MAIAQIAAVKTGIKIDIDAVRVCEEILASLKSGSAHGFCGVVKTDDGFRQFITQAISDTQGDAAGVALFSLMDSL